MFVKNDSRDIVAINPDAAKGVKIEPLTEQHRMDFEHIDIQPRACFQNTYNIVSRYPDKYAYVLGINNSFGFAFEHAFIKDLKTGDYIDPTLDAIGRVECEEGIFSLVEFDSTELADNIVAQGEKAYPPDFKVMSKLKLYPEIFIDFKRYRAMELSAEATCNP